MTHDEAPHKHHPLPSNGTGHSTTPPTPALRLVQGGQAAPPAYTEEQLAQLTSLGVTLTWEDLDAEDRLERILANPYRKEWYQRTPCDCLATLADFRAIAPRWEAICEQWEAYGGKTWRLEKAV